MVFALEGSPYSSLNVALIFGSGIIGNLGIYDTDIRGDIPINNVGPLLMVTVWEMG